MDTGLTFEMRQGYLLVTGEGTRDDLTTAIERAQQIEQYAIKSGVKHVLIDYRKLVFNLPIAQAFNIVKVYESQLPTFKDLIISAVGNENNRELAKFWESVSNRRGFKYKTFDKITDAEDWILKEMKKAPVKK